MSRRRLTIIGVLATGVAGLCTAAIIALTGRGFGTGTSAEEACITQPEAWVPLTVEYEVRHAGTGMRYVEHRASDGSTRVTRVDGGQEVEIQIDNLSTGRYYLFRGGRWREHPLRPRRDQGRPSMVLDRRTVTPVPADDPRVAGFAEVPMALSFYEFRAPGSASVIFCPELNMLRAWSKDQESEYRVTRVEIGEPTVTFEPPAGVPVEVRSEPAGRGSIAELPSRSRGDR